VNIKMPLKSTLAPRAVYGKRHDLNGRSWSNKECKSMLVEGVW
jgi:hypothetical protein